MEHHDLESLAEEKHEELKRVLNFIEPYNPRVVREAAEQQYNKKAFMPRPIY